jgi:outer membrane protein OmpA-like peptidoglycan-associated protein
MLVGGPQRGLFLTCLGTAVCSLVALDFCFAPAAFEAPRADVLPKAPTSSSAPPPPGSRPAPALTTRPPVVAATPSDRAPAAAPALPAIARVPTIVAQFDSLSSQPGDESGIRALAAAMLEDHEAKVVLEGHSDMRGAEDYNQQISLARAEWVKRRIVDMGVSPERIQTVGLGATHPLRIDDPDAQALNRRVEVRWLGR